MGVLVLLIATCNLELRGQENQTGTVGAGSSLDLKADIVSRYYWRGLLYCASPNVQPSLTYTNNGFSVGTWASMGLSERYSEVDLYLSYTKGAFTFMLYDYFCEDENDLTSTDYFNWKNSLTGHQLEATIIFGDTEKFPFTVTAATFFYGADKDDDGDNCYSTYFEVMYPFQICNHDVNVFIGGTPASGLYHNGANVVNMGFSASHTIDITPSFKIPITGTFAVNPAAEDVFFILGITI